MSLINRNKLISKFTQMIFARFVNIDCSYELYSRITRQIDNQFQPYSDKSIDDNILFKFSYALP